jgi:uncharacterized glyoxalase superfamily protein PhnB
MTVRLGARVTPSLLVADMAASLRFYELLGFRLTGCSPGDAPTWAEVQRDGVIIQFFSEAPDGVPAKPCLSGTIYLHPDGVDALAAELRRKVQFAWGPEDMPYGMREFAVQDPSGYFIAFTEPIRGSATK